MIESFYFGAYWGPRRETPEECAGRTSEFLSGLGSGDPLFRQWFKKGWSRKDALKHQICVSHDALTDLFAAGAHHRDSDRTIIRELGFLVSAWTGGPDGECASLSIKCGGYFHGIPNSCVIRFPYRGEVADRVLQVEVLSQIMLLGVRYWEPDWATFNSAELREALNIPLSEPQIGWLTYISSARGSVLPLTSPSRIQTIDGFGTLIITTEERFSSERTDHVEAASRVKAAVNEGRRVTR
jgi:hypothetical protein